MMMVGLRLTLLIDAALAFLMNASRLDFGIVGAQKGGTTGLAELFRKRGDLCLGPNEAHLFSHARRRDEAEADVAARWTSVAARARAGCPAGGAAGFDDPAFAYYGAGAPRQVAAFADFAPEIRLVMLLREPIQRARSQHGMMAAGTKSRKFLRNRPLEAVAAEELAGNATARDAYDIVRRGLYDEQVALLRGLGFRLQIVISERAFASTAAYDAVFRFVGVAPPAPYPSVFRRPTRTPSPLSRAAAELLAAAYRGPTDRLYDLLGGPVPEWEAWYAAAGLPKTTR